LSRVLIEQSPPKSTPRRLLERNIDLSSFETREIESPLKSKSIYSAKPTTGKSTKPIIKVYSSSDDSQNVVKYTPLHTSNAPDSATSAAFIYPSIDEDTIIEQFCQVQPWYTAEGVKKELPDPSERDQRLRMYADFIPYFSRCMFLSRSLSSNYIAQASASEQTHKVHSNVSENIPFDRKPLPDIDPKDMELFEAAISEEKEIKPKLFTCMNVTRKVTHNLPFV